MAGMPAGTIGDLVAAARPTGGEDSIGCCCPELWQYTQLADLQRHFVVLNLVAERAGHAAAGRVESLDSETRDQSQRCRRRTNRIESLLVTMPVQ